MTRTDGGLTGFATLDVLAIRVAYQVSTSNDRPFAAEEVHETDVHMVISDQLDEVEWPDSLILYLAGVLVMRGVTFDFTDALSIYKAPQYKDGDTCRNVVVSELFKPLTELIFNFLTASGYERKADRVIRIT